MDAHCHLSDSAFDAQRQEIYAELLDQRIQGLVLAGTDPKDWLKQKALTLPEGLRVAKVFGLHPWWVDQFSDEDIGQALATLQSSLTDCQGLGEVGLDYFRAKTVDERIRQKKWFAAQLTIASSTDHPLVLHIVRAHHEALPMLQKQKTKLKGLVHAFWANRSVAKSYIDLGFLLSLPPRIMKEDPYQLLSQIDPEHVVFETDTPFMDADQQCVRPVFLHKLLAFAAEKRGESLEHTVQRQQKLLTRLFPILQGDS